jgi:hypothetical protein
MINWLTDVGIVASVLGYATLTIYCFIEMAQPFGSILAFILVALGLGTEIWVLMTWVFI